MTRTCIILAMLTAGGCASHRAEPKQAERLPAHPLYDDSVAATLVFAPPLTFGEPPLVLARELRQPSLFVGFEDVTTSAFWIRTDDRQTDGEPDRYYRRAVIEKTGVSYR